MSPGRNSTVLANEGLGDRKLLTDRDLQWPLPRCRWDTERQPSLPIVGAMEGECSTKGGLDINQDHVCRAEAPVVLGKDRVTQVGSLPAMCVVGKAS